jgi:iron complex outermembrane receptor protein
MSVLQKTLLSGAGLSLVYALSLLVSPTVHAQSADAAASDQLTEIVVTARKTKESLVTTPVAVTALTAADIEIKGITDIIGIAAFSPGFTDQNQQVNRNDRSFTSYIIRGVAEAGGTSSQIRPAVTTFLDGSPIAAGQIPQLTDIQQIEVVKGPQSAYFGRSSFAGAVNFISKMPGAEWKESIDAKFYTYGGSDVNIALEGPVVEDKLAIRVGLRSFHEDGQYSEYGYPGDKIGARDTKSASASFYATPTDNLTAKLFVTMWHDDDGPAANAQYLSSSYNCAAGAAGTRLNYICGQLPTQYPVQTRFYNLGLSPFVYNSLEDYTGKAQRILGADFIDHFGLEKVVAMVHSSVDYTFENDYVLSANGAYDSNKWAFLTDTTFRNGTSIPNASYGVIPNVLPYFSRSALGDELNIDKSIEIRLTSPRDDRFKWMVGGTYYYQINEALTDVFGTTGLIASSLPTDTEINTFGLFASASYEIWDGLSISGEARYQLDQIAQQTTLSGLRESLSGNFHSVTPRIILQYVPEKNESIYLSYAEGNRPGEFNTQYYVEPPAIQRQILAQAAVSPSVPEENIRMWELGVKGSFMENRLRLLADIYYGRWTGRHITDPVNVISNGVLLPLQVISAGGVTDLDGFEVEGTYVVTPELTMDGSFDIAASDIKQTFCSDCSLTTGNPYPTGTLMPGYPKYTAALGGEYHRPIPMSMFPDLEGYARLDWTWRSRIYDSESDVAWTPNQSLFNLKAGVTTGPYRFELYGINILDDKTPTSLARNTDPLNSQNTISISLPTRATFGVHVSAKF